MKLRFHTKVSLVFLVGLLGCMVLLNLLSGLMLRPMFIADSRRQMASYGAQIEDALSKGSEGEDMEELLSSFRDAYLINTTILDQKEELEYSTLVPSSKKKTKVRWPRWMLSLLEEFHSQSGNPYIQEKYNDEDQLKHLKYVRRSRDGRIIILSKSIRGIEQDVQIVSQFLMIACLAVAVAGVLIWMIFTRSFSHSLERMSQVTRSLSQLDFSEKVNYQGSVKEIKVLASSIDQMSTRLEQSLSELQRDLEHQKELLRNLSHEIKTPLTTIKGYTENMQIVVQGNQRAERYCGIILEECEALDWLAIEMIDVSTLESSDSYYEKRILSAEELFHQVQQRIEREMAGQNITVEYQEGQLYGNPYLLERAVFNYLVNALKYRTHGTAVLLRGKRNEDRYELSVSNIGEPIPEEEQDRIWEAFYKGDKSRKRSGSYGIGLSIVRQIANIHRAEVGVLCRSDWNTFYFSAPSEPFEEETKERPVGV